MPTVDDRKRVIPAQGERAAQWCSLPARLRLWGATVWRAEGGVSAVEFALFAPVLFFGLVATADIGLVLYERMGMDHALRIAAQSAMADPGEAEVLDVLKATAMKNFILASPEATADPTALALSVERVCACSDDVATVGDCAVTCPASTHRYSYYRLSVSKVYDGMILPSIRLSPSLQVQVQ